MDLYIQIGVLLLFLTALSLFIYLYTSPSAMFSQGISEKNAEVAERMDAIKDQDLREALNNPNLSGSKAINLIRNAESKGVAVIIQTKNSQGLVVNYGNQLRTPDLDNIEMKPAGASKGNNPNSFEKRYVTSAQTLFNSGAVGGSSSVRKGAAYGTERTLDFANRVLTTRDSKYPYGSVNYHLENGTTDHTVAPHLMYSQANTTIGDAKRSNEVIGSTGFLYTDNLIYSNQEANKNFSYLENTNSIYYVSKSSNFYSTLIKNSNNQTVGVYLEEHGVNDLSSYLRASMKLEGTIN